MKKVLFFALAASLAACGNGGEKESGDEKTADKTEKTAEDTEGEDEVSYPYYAGEEFDESEAITVDKLTEKLADFNGDSMQITLTADIAKVCKKKGCWMKLDMADKEEMMVRFKDYDFFVPLNSDGRQTTVRGMVFYDTISVNQLKHYAEDGGASADSIAKITEPEITLSFLADGVVVK